MKLWNMVYLLALPTVFGFVKRASTTVRPRTKYFNYKLLPTYIHTHTTMHPDARKQANPLFPHKATKYVVTPNPIKKTFKLSKSKPSFNLKISLTTPKYSYLKHDSEHHRTPAPLAYYHHKNAKKNEALLREKVPQSSLEISSEETNTETNDSIMEDFNQEVLSNVQLVEKFDTESDLYEGTLRNKGLQRAANDAYEETMKIKQPSRSISEDLLKTKVAIKGMIAENIKSVENSPVKEILRIKAEVPSTKDLVENSTIETPKDTKIMEIKPNMTRFSHLRSKRYSKYYAQDLEGFNKDLEELIFHNGLDSESDEEQNNNEAEDIMEITFF